jgi:hypothetical protein
LLFGLQHHRIRPNPIPRRFRSSNITRAHPAIMRIG